MKLYLFTILILIELSACSQNTSQNTQNDTQNANLKPSPSPSATISKEEAERNAKESRDEKLKAIHQFIASHYKGWKYAGIANDEGYCEEYTMQACNLLLSKGAEEKVVAVLFKRFEDANGKKRLVVFEMRSIDLAQAKIEDIKEWERESVLENLEYDDCESVCQDAD